MPFGVPPAPPRTAAAPITALPTLPMLVALAAEESGPERRRRLAAEATTALDELEALHAATLAGVVTSETIAVLARWRDTHARSDDPRLAALIDEIDLRVQVELEKRRSSA